MLNSTKRVVEFREMKNSRFVVMFSTDATSDMNADVNASTRLESPRNSTSKSTNNAMETRTDTSLDAHGKRLQVVVLDGMSTASMCVVHLVKLTGKNVEESKHVSSRFVIPESPHVAEHGPHGPTETKAQSVAQPPAIVASPD